MPEMERLTISEINTWVWLHDLETRTGTSLTLDTIPEIEWDSLAALGFNAVWLMGVWTRSPMGRRISQENVDLYTDYEGSLPGWQMSDLPGSPYCIREYKVDPRFGGDDALIALRETLRKKGMKLILDFVPNHVALDHRWVTSHPEYLIGGSELDLMQFPQNFFQSSHNVFCKGRDPFFPPWQDVAQLNAFSPAYRKAAVEQVRKIGQLCDGIRCDMAMLLLNNVFSYTWQNRAGIPPKTEFWHDVISGVRKKNPDFIFIAETYWDLEWDLMQLGFDYCYDKRLYDRLIHESTETIRQHLAADVKFQTHLVRFLENHDEPRAAGVLSPLKLKAASVIAATLPGAVMLYEGQWDGRKIRNHVLLGRRQPENVDEAVQSFYKNLLPAVSRIKHEGAWQLCPVEGWQDNNSCRNILAYFWQKDGGTLVVIVNYSDVPSQGRVRLPEPVTRTAELVLTDLFVKEPLVRNGADTAADGLFVDLPGWGFHFFTINE